MKIHVSSAALQDKLDLLGDPHMEEVFSGSHEDLEQTAQQLYTSPPWTQHLHLEATPQQVPPTLGAVLQKTLTTNETRDQICSKTPFRGDGGSDLCLISKTCHKPTI